MLLGGVWCGGGLMVWLERGLCGRGKCGWKGTWCGFKRDRHDRKLYSEMFLKNKLPKMIKSQENQSVLPERKKTLGNATKELQDFFSLSNATKRKLFISSYFFFISPRMGFPPNDLANSEMQCHSCCRFSL